MRVPTTFQEYPQLVATQLPVNSSMCFYSQRYYLHWLNEVGTSGTTVTEEEVTGGFEPEQLSSARGVSTR